MDATPTSNCTHCADLGREKTWNPRTLRQGLCQVGYRDAKATGALPVKRLPKGQRRQCKVVVDGKRCPHDAKAHGLCSSHVARHYRGAQVDTPIRDGAAQAEECGFNGCAKPRHSSDGLCAGHTTQKRQGKPLTPLRSYIARGGACSVDDCDREVANDGICHTHYERRRGGEEDWDRPIRRKAKEGEGWYSDGYFMVRKNGRNRGEHLWIAEDLLCRPLRKGENVHHRNGNRSDNRTDGPFVMTPHGKLLSGNLEVWSTKQPAGQEIGPKLDYAAEMFEEYLQYLDPARARHLLALAARVTPEQISVERERALAALDVEPAAHLAQDVTG